MRRYQIEFERLAIGDTFRLGATNWVKSSTRTARVFDNGKAERVFYFSRNDLCVINSATALPYLEQLENGE